MSESGLPDPGAQAEAEDPRTRDVTSADPGPVDGTEGLAAADGLTASPEVDEHHREMTEAGADVRGDGEVR